MIDPRATASAPLAGRDRVTVESAVLPAYDEETKLLATTWNNCTQYGLFVAALMGGAFFLAKSENGLQPLHYGASLAAGLFAVFFMAKRGQLAAPIMC